MSHSGNVGLWGQAQENADFLASVVAVNKKILCLYSRSHNFLLTSMKLYQATLFSRKYGSISDPSQFLTEKTIEDMSRQHTEIHII